MFGVDAPPDVSVSKVSAQEGTWITKTLVKYVEDTYSPPVSSSTRLSYSSDSSGGESFCYKLPDQVVAPAAASAITSAAAPTPVLVAAPVVSSSIIPG